MMASDHKHVEILGAGDVTGVVSVLNESFFDYPVMRFVLGRGRDYGTRLETLITFFTMARVLRNEVLLGVRGPSGLTAIATISYPDRGPGPPELDAFREETWKALGNAARSRYEEFGAVAAQFALDSYHTHLNMLGVRPSAQGQGLGRALLEFVHAMSASDASSAGVTLSTEVESNVGLYQRFGYEVLGSAPVRSAFTTWVMFRRDSAESSGSPTRS